VPVAFSIGLAAVATSLRRPAGGGRIPPHDRGHGVFSFLAIPFFIFAGELMLYGGIADRIVQFAKNSSATCARRSGHVQAYVAWHSFGGRLSGSPVADVFGHGRG